MKSHLMFASLLGALSLWGGRIQSSASAQTVAQVSTAEQYVQALGAGVGHLVITDHLDLRNVTVEKIRAARTAVSTSSIRVSFPRTSVTYSMPIGCNRDRKEYGRSPIESAFLLLCSFPSSLPGCATPVSTLDIARNVFQSRSRAGAWTRVNRSA